MAYNIESTFQERIFTERELPFTLHYDRLSAQYTVLTHWHEEIEILYFDKGEAYAFCNQEKIYCKAGDIIFFNSFTFHGLERITEESCYHCFFFDISIIDKEILNSADLPLFSISDNAELQALFNKIIEEDQKRLPQFDTITKHYLNLALLQIMREACNKPDSHLSKASNRKDHHDDIRNAIFYINNNISKKITLDDLCEITQLSRSRFSTIFSAHTGKSLMDFINALRCQYARSLFLTGNYSVAECAEKAGFSNMSYFARKYRQIYGTTLSQTTEK